MHKSLYFITFRLAGSLPFEVINKLKEEYEIEEKHIEAIKDVKAKMKELDDHRIRYFKRFDEFLDKNSNGPMWLRENSVAKIVADAIKYRDSKEYELIAYCIMPNHVHMVINVERSDDVERTLVRAGSCDRTIRRTPSGKFDLQCPTKIIN